MVKTNGKSYYEECQECPYFGQSHLTNEDRVIRSFVPLELECNNSEVLIILQSPGSEEWKIGKSLQPTTKQGGTAGSRVLKSWESKKKKRTDFDIVEAVRCYPSKSERDNEPVEKAKLCCSKILEREINSNKYSTIIVFGTQAKEVISMVMNNINIEDKMTVIFVKHPNGRLKNVVLDSLW